MKWRILIHGKLSPEENMAIDEAVMLSLINGNGYPTIRFYDWAPSTASIGYNQISKKEIDFNLLKDKGYGFVRRPTGGRLVLHHEEVTYAVIAPLEGRLQGNVLESYAEISQALASGLHNCNINVQFEKGSLSSEHQRENNNPCFTSASKYELKVDGKKIVGSAQVRKENVLLQHGSILLNYNQSIVADIMPGLDTAKRSKVAKYLERKTVSINELLDTKIGFEEAVENIIKGFQNAWSNDVFDFETDLSLREREIVDELKMNKYSKDEWNYKK